MNDKKVLNYIKENLFNILTIIFTAYSIYQQYDIYNKSKQIKTLQIVVLANSPLIEDNKSIAHDVIIPDPETSSANLTLLNILIDNIGNEPIMPVDFMKPLSLVFPANVKIIGQPEILEANPTDLEIDFAVEKNKIVLIPTLLNQGENFTIQIIVSSDIPINSDSPFKTEARIVGARVQTTNAIEFAKDRTNVLSPQPNFLILIGLWGLFGGFSAAIYRSFKGTPLRFQAIIVRSILGMCLGFLFYFAFISGLVVLQEKSIPIYAFDPVVALLTFAAGFSDSLTNRISRTLSSIT